MPAQSEQLIIENTPEAAPTVAPREPVKHPGAGWLTKYSGLALWAGVILLFGVLQPDTFLTMDTVRSILSDQAITATMALALLLPLAAGVYDLSVAAMMGVSIMLVAYFQVEGVPWGLAVLLVLVIGACVGLINAAVVVWLGVDSFIATLGASSILLAMIQWVNGGQQITTGISTTFTDFATTQVFTIALPVFYMLFLAGVLWYVTEYRQIGRYMFATGSNPDAARLAGVRTAKLQAIALVVSAVIASFAGILFTAKIGSASPDSGPPYLLPAFAGVFLGATQIKQGRVNVPGTLIAVFLLATGVKGLQLSGAANWVDDAFNGVALILAVALAVRSSRKRRS
jgi:ribose transport system permease protein